MKVWVYKRCRFIRTILELCFVCLDNYTASIRKARELCGDIFLECLYKFCYLNNIIISGSRAEANLVSRIRSVEEA